MNKVNISEKLNLINEYWKPKIIGELNGQQIRIVKIKGEFIFHEHDQEDEFFMVIKGILKMELKDKVIELKEGECIIIPKGILHKPVAEKEAHLLLFEPATVLNTGNIRNELTVESPDRI